jgi:hypothetical protein
MVEVVSREVPKASAEIYIERRIREKTTALRMYMPIIPPGWRR